MRAPWVAIQRNPNSGSGRRRRHLLEFVRALRKRGLNPRLFSRREKLDVALSNPEAREALICLVPAGGDGTVSDVINRFPGVTICPFPLGTENVLCRHLGIGHDGDKVADMIAAGKKTTLDLGVFLNAGSDAESATKETRFVLMGSAGFDAEVIHRLHRSRRGNIGKLTYAKPILGSLSGYPYPMMRVYFDDSETPVEGSLVVVSNLPAYAFRLPMTPDAVGDDGLFSVCVFERPGSFQLARYFFQVIRRKHFDRPGVQHTTARKVRIETDSPVPLQIDGEAVGESPCEMTMLPGALTVIVP